MLRLPVLILWVSLVPLALTIQATPAAAGMCDGDDDAAATLLLPYFEVNLDNPAAGNTLFSINNAFAEPALAHVTLWTDWSHPTVAFDVFLTGYDVQQVNLADLFLNGNLPVTADEQSDPVDTTSPHGGFRPSGGYIPGSTFPEQDGSFSMCEQFLPFYTNPLIVGAIGERVVNGHTGQPVPNSGFGCLGADFGDNIARGYVTIDRVNRCSIAFPSERDENYFESGGVGIASNQNQLWGDWIYFDTVKGFAHGDSLVHIEALDGFDAVGSGTSDPTVPGPATGYTFYSRYADFGEDNREPLGVTWAARYLNNALFEPGGTELFVWRDPTVDEAEQSEGFGYVCGAPGQAGSGPEWHPLDESLVLAFDEYENSVQICQTCPVCDPPSPDDYPHCFPLAAQRLTSTDLGYIGESPPWGAGWLYLDLRFPYPDDTAFGDLSQSYVFVTHSAVGLLSVGLPALELTSACDTFDDSQTPDV